MTTDKKQKTGRLIPIADSKAGIYIFSSKERFRDSVSNANTEQLKAALAAFRGNRDKRR